LIGENRLPAIFAESRPSASPCRRQKSVVFAGVPTLRGDFRGVAALSEPMPPAKSVVFAGVPILRGRR
jgi:hypothetical protein